LIAEALSALLALLHSWAAVRSARGMASLPRPSGEARDGPLVSVIVPARNEEGRIGDCIRSILSQRYREIELIVVDDGSEDRTAEEAEEAVGGDERASVVRAPKRPPGWVGKSWPCWVGYLRSRGDLLLFADADVRMDPGAVGSAVRLMGELGADALSLIPRFRCSGLACGSVELALSSAVRLFGPYWRGGWLFGAFSLIDRGAYEAVGGHRSVRWSLVEDRELGRLLSEAGFRVVIARSGGLVETSWAEGWGEALEAIARISSADAPEPGRADAVSAAVALASALPPALALLSPAGLVALAAELIHASLSLLWEVDAPLASVPLAPLGGLVTALGIALGSRVRFGGRPVSWRGISLSPARPGGRPG